MLLGILPFLWYLLQTHYLALKKIMVWTYLRVSHHSWGVLHKKLYEGYMKAIALHYYGSKISHIILLIVGI